MELNKDWLFVDGDKMYNFRGSGVLIHENKLLVQRGINDTDYALTGGQVKFGETSAETVVREYKEEMGAVVLADRLIWVEESFWKWGQRDCHTICHYHLLKLKNPAQIPLDGTFKSSENDESRLLFTWIPLFELTGFQETIYPVFIKEKIFNIKDGIEHFIYRE